MSSLKLYGALALVLGTLLFAAWVGHLINQHTEDQAALKADAVTHAADLVSIEGERKVNADNLVLMAKQDAEAQTQRAAAAAELAAAKESQTFVVETKKEIHRVTSPTAPAPGPATLAALGRLRERHAALTGGDHQAGGSPAPAHAPGTANVR